MRTNTAVSIELLALDFDGTIISYDLDQRGVFHHEAIRELNRMGELGVDWVTNSGRDYNDQMEVLERSFQQGLQHRPKGLICSESLVFVAGSNGEEYDSLEPWNHLAMKKLKQTHSRVQWVLKPHLNTLLSTYNPEPVIWSDYATAFLVPQLDRCARSLYGELERILAPLKHVAITMNGGWVAVVLRELGKGNALAAFSDHRGISRDRILAIGDHLNDMPMLNGMATDHAGCPGDAVPEVQKAVRGIGGFVASLPGPQGSVEIIRHYIPETA